MPSHETNKKCQNNSVRCLKRGRIGFESSCCHIPLIKMLIQGGFSWSPGLLFSTLANGTQSVKCKTRLEDHLRLQGHKSHAAEDDEELQRIRIHFHIFLSCHISCQSVIYIHLDLISPPRSLSVSGFLCIGGYLLFCTCQNILLKTKSERQRT